MTHRAKHPLKIKIFQSLQGNLAILGIDSFQSIQKDPLNARNLLSLILQCFFIVSSLLYTLYEANSFQEYTDGLSSILALIICNIDFGIITLEMAEWFKNFQFSISEVMDFIFMDDVRAHK